MDGATVGLGEKHAPIVSVAVVVAHTLVTKDVLEHVHCRALPLL